MLFYRPNIVMPEVVNQNVQANPRKEGAFDANTFLYSPVMSGQVADHRPGDTIYSRGDPSDTLFYIQQGAVKLTVISPTGREAGRGDLGRRRLLW